MTPNPNQFSQKSSFSPNLSFTLFMVLKFIFGDTYLVPKLGNFVIYILMCKIHKQAI